MARSAKADESVEETGDEAAEPQAAAGDDTAADVAAVDGERGSADHRLAAEKRAAAAAGLTDRAKADIDALLVERRGYVLRGMDARVAQVDEQLALRGYQG